MTFGNFTWWFTPLVNLRYRYHKYISINMESNIMLHISRSWNVNWHFIQMILYKFLKSHSNRFYMLSLLRIDKISQRMISFSVRLDRIYWKSSRFLIYFYALKRTEYSSLCAFIMSTEYAVYFEIPEFFYCARFMTITREREILKLSERKNISYMINLVRTIVYACVDISKHII